MNKVVLIGRLTRDPDLRYTPNGTAVANFSLAVNRRFKQEGQQEADFISCVAWGAVGENLCTYQGKGSQVAVHGRIQVRSYEAKDGTKRYVTEVVAEEVEFLGSKNQANQGFGDPLQDFTPIDGDDGDLPF